MKLCNSLAASLVGFAALSVTTAAFADSAKPVLVAQAQPAPSDEPTTTNPPPADEPAPVAEPAAPSTQPAVSVTLGGSSAPPGADTPQDPASTPEAKPEPRRWAGTSIFGQTSMSTATVFKGQQQDWNPTVDSALFLLPRFALSDAFQLRGRMIFSYEYTDSDNTVSKHEPRFSDATVQLFYRKIPAFAGIKPLVALNVTAPTSPESRARTMIVTPGVTLQLSKPFEHFLGGDLLLLGTANYTHPFYENTTPGIRGDAPYGFNCAGGGGVGCGDQLSGAYNASDTISYMLLATATWGHWSPALMYLGSNQWAYTGNNIPNNTGGGTGFITAPEGFNSTSFRQLHYFSAWLDYEFNGWLTAEIGYYMSRAALGADGKYGNPFFDRYQDMRVYLGMNITVDNLIQVITGGGHGEAGIVRAQNNRRPLWTF